MGMYLNPGSVGFEEILKSEYIDVTGFVSDVKKSGGNIEDVPDIISKKIVEEVWKICPELSDNNSFYRMYTEIC